MRVAASLLGPALLITACAETPIEDQGDAAVAEIEKQLEGDAQSLESAADEAASILEEEIAEELQAEGVATPVPVPTRPVAEEP